MRFTTAILVVAVIACGSDRVTTPQPRLVGLSLEPDSASIDTAGTLQLTPTLVWSDGGTHETPVTYTATGGTISTTGLYTAGSIAGHFTVIVACTCGLAHTMPVSIGYITAPVAPTVARLTISVAGLPVGGIGTLHITGPEGFQRDVTAPSELDSLTPGDYAVHAATAVVGPDIYDPSPADQTITLAAAQVMDVAVTYAKEVAPPPTGLPAHPRVWMTPARLQQIQAQAQANTVRWQRLKAAAELQVAKGSTYTSNDTGMLPAVCLAYLASGDVRYAQRAAVVLAASAVETNTLQGDAAYNYRYLGNYSVGLDWCYNALSVPLRQQVATWLMNRADWVWPESNPAPHNAYGVTQIPNNYYWGYMMTGPAALAAAGDDTGKGTISGSNRPAYHQQLVLTKWTTVAMPYFAGKDAGGASEEGTGYDISGHVGEFVDAFRTSGINISTPWLTQALQWHMHASMPGYKYFAPIGDQARVSNAPEYIYNREAMLIDMVAANADPVLNSQVQTWLGLIGQVPTRSDDGAVSSEFLRYDPNAASAPDLSGLPKGYLATGAGDFVYRQSWTDPNATVLVFRSGPMGQGHTGLDANSMRIWKGSFWVSADANIYSHSGIQQTTDNYNDLTVGGVGQSHHDGTFIVDASFSDTLAVVRGQASLGYLARGANLGSPTSVPDYLRTVAYLPEQDAFVVVDRVTVVDGTKDKVWRWQMKDVPQVTGNTFRLQNPNGDARCFGRVLLPTDAVLGTQSFTTSNAVTVTLTGRASDVVVTVLQCTTGISEPVVPTVTASPAAMAVTVGSRRVTVPLDEHQPVRLDTP